MNSLPITINLEIPNDPEKIYECTKSILANIQEHVALDLGYQRRIKMIVIELITNSIKHASGDLTQIHLTIDHPSLSIQKIEKGVKIEFSAPSPQIPFKELGKTLNVSFSDVKKHDIQPLSPYKFQFLKPAETDAVDIDHIPEHFGLYIITKAADQFTYQYDPELGESSFVVQFY